MKKIKFCPRCKSTKLTMKFIMPLGAIHPDINECKDCGFVGVFPEIGRNKIEKFQKIVKTEKRNYHRKQ